MSNETETEPLVSRRALPVGKVTYEEFLEWLEDGVRAEWVDGEVIILGPNANPHQRLLLFVAALFYSCVQFQLLDLAMMS